MDLHIHIGRTMYGDPVKITASDQLTLTKVVQEASARKGLHIVGVIDAHVPAVQKEVKLLIEKGEATELEGGGVEYNSLTLILGSEIEIYDENCQGPIHVLCYFPFLETMQYFTSWLGERMTNINLSSQRFYGNAKELQQKVRELGGIFIPAHIFTPFKSLYGKGVKASLSEVLDPELIDAIELGLSADSDMADQIKELHSYTYVTNSDAHSLPKIAREYQSIRLKEATYKELKLALNRVDKRGILANYGLNPLLGKYHDTVCAQCLHPHSGEIVCQQCGAKRFIKGVGRRIEELSDTAEFSTHRPSYIHQVPLEYIPKLGPKTLTKLIETFGDEMTILHYATEDELLNVVPSTIVERILANRNGELSIKAGGGGRYGKLN